MCYWNRQSCSSNLFSIMMRKPVRNLLDEALLTGNLIEAVVVDLLKSIFGLSIILLGCGDKVLAEIKTGHLIDARSVLGRGGEIIVDGEVEVDLDGDGLAAERIFYSVNRIGPATTCGPEDACDSSVEPVLSWRIGINGETTYIDYFCATINIGNSVTNGMRDVFCGDTHRLVWNGKNYVDLPN